ncbi:MAG: hypothetical protein RLZZ316_1458 [Bacteroidota bacterium]
MKIKFLRKHYILYFAPQMLNKTNVMRKSYRYLAALLMAGIFSIAAYAQTATITGTVKNGTNKDVVPAVSVMVKGTAAGTFTDEKGNFKLVTSQKLPLTLILTSVGFETKEVTVSSAGQNIDVEFTPSSSLGTEVVVSASRVPERILESPVSIERISVANIRNTPSANYYDILKNLKGVDMTYSSLTFATPSTRGFNASGNARFTQLVDGMDNQAPGLNFSVGSVIGLTELDVESMELLPGASSALYGPGGMNGTLLINSKSPFKYQGLSLQVKQGLMHTDRKQRSTAAPFYDWSFRWGKVVTPKFAFKIGAQFIQAKDWVATDYRNYQAGDASANQYGNVKAGDRLTDPAYNGVNVYGDETMFDTKNINGTNLFGLVASGVRAQLAGSPTTAPLVPLFDNVVAGYTTPFNVSRTGYRENEIVNNNTINVRLSGGLYYKLTDNLEASITGNWGTGNTVYTGSDRYSLKDLKVGQYKVELKHKNWYLRAYTTQENSGESFNATVTTQLFNEAWKPSASWYQQYMTTFFLSKMGLLPGQTPGSVTSDYNSHLNARGSADVGRPASGTQAFKSIFDQVRKIPIPRGGLFVDRSDLYNIEGQYNFGNKLKFAEVIVGANYKQYVLNSQGTLFADTAGAIKINEFGGYIQATRKLFKEKLKLSASARGDKNENFKGRITPRFTAVYEIAKNHNFRVSAQSAYRFPTTQQQWINLNVGGGVRLIGGLPQLRDYYKFNTNPAYTVESFKVFAFDAQTTGVPKPQLLKQAVFPEFKPESLRSLEVGYKGLFGKKVFVDAYGYYGEYKNFLGRRIAVQSTNGSPLGLLGLGGGQRSNFSVATNSTAKVNTYGYGVSIDWVLPRNFAVNANFSQDKRGAVEAGFVSFFNVPSYRFIVGLSNTGFGYQKRMGFAATLRTQDGFYYESDFRQGEIPGFTTLDAQVNYKIPSKRSIIKLGATNLFNKYYFTAFGNPAIGGQYYVSFGYNVF